MSEGPSKNIHQSVSNKKEKFQRIFGLLFLRKTWMTTKESESRRLIISTSKQIVNHVPLDSKKSRISSTDLSCDMNYTPSIGVAMGFTKDECIRRFLSETRADHHFSISNRRTCLIQLANAWALARVFSGARV